MAESLAPSPEPPLLLPSLALERAEQRRAPFSSCPPTKKYTGAAPIRGDHPPSFISSPAAPPLRWHWPPASAGCGCGHPSRRRSSCRAPQRVVYSLTNGRPRSAGRRHLSATPTLHAPSLPTSARLQGPSWKALHRRRARGGGRSEGRRPLSPAAAASHLGRVDLRRWWTRGSMVRGTSARACLVLA